MESVVSSVIINSYFQKLNDSLKADVAIVGGGPSGLVAAAIIAEGGYSVNLYEKNTAPGGGMWGGAMMFNSILIEENAASIAAMSGINLSEASNGNCVADSVQATAALINRACCSGARIFNCITVEDLTFNNNDEVSGVVINWSPVLQKGMMIDPLMTKATAVLDATGHPAEIATKLARKNGVELSTGSSSVPGERSLNVELGERNTVEFTGEIYPGLFVSGMSACAAGGGYRMGPIFGGMLLSGSKAAAEIIRKIVETG
jgi:thiamine thiazole synthase